MASRDELLAALRRNAPPPLPRPTLEGLGIRWPDPLEQYAASLRSVGGSCVRAADRSAAHRALAELPAYREARRVVSLVPGVGHATVDLAEVDDPRQLEGLDLAVLPGALAVAENGAVWVDGAALPHRAAFVIAEHLVLVVDAADVVDDLHAAYARLEGRRPSYGLFLSGPSKTADIEQALVIGAQGARSCTVLVVG